MTRLIALTLFTTLLRVFTPFDQAASQAKPTTDFSKLETTILAERMGFEIVGEFIDYVSGATEDHPELKSPGRL